MGWIKTVLYTLMVLNIINILSIFNFNDDIISKKENQELFAWVKENTQPQEHYMFWRPRAMALLTGRIGTAPWVHPNPKESLEERIHRWNISYVIFDKREDQPLVKSMEKNPQIAHPVWENGIYKIFKVNNFVTQN